MKLNQHRLFISAAASLNPVQGLSIYRNSIREIISRALSIIYPVSEQLLGTDCFRRVVSDFQLHADLSSHSLEYIGEGFPEYIGSIQSLSSLPWLEDVARLELSIQNVQVKK